eukprot:NODE_895_length_1130_cov_85.132602_g853_i0.p2 GENE.NODE_895_length_1130_cov_85.132602_g853_i0~~NODE_895_length_1130_cov_85.132602_g853_i0.p2  ORF type:complete len:137 (-),score=0.98 NODE_895_length_1130_cov_85.132602_g853_i0:514-924(-)
MQRRRVDIPTLLRNSLCKKLRPRGNHKKARKIVQYPHPKFRGHHCIHNILTQFIARLNQQKIEKFPSQKHFPPRNALSKLKLLAEHHLGTDSRCKTSTAHLSLPASKKLPDATWTGFTCKICQTMRYMKMGHSIAS